MTVSTIATNTQLSRTKTTRVDLIIPVYNEEDDLSASILRLSSYLEAELPYSYRILIADNASTDATWAIAQRLAWLCPNVGAVHLDAKGRGRALRQVWLASDADIVAYMDVDLSTDLKGLLPLIAPLASGHSDIAIGSRLARGSRVTRGPKREFISRTYNLLLRTVLRVSFSDAQCGFKAVRSDVAQRLLPLVEDNNWFFDTEMLVLAERAGLRIHEVPVDWVDDPGSTVDIVATAREDLAGIWRLLRGFASRSVPLDRVRAELRRPGVPAAVPGVASGLLGQLLRFGAVGLSSTVAFFGLYLWLRPLGAQPANLIALLVTAIANTAANRRFTFGVKGKAGALRHHLGGLATFCLALGLTSGSIWLLGILFPKAGYLAEAGVLVAANAAATLIRFLALRLLMNSPGATQAVPGKGSPTEARSETISGATRSTPVSATFGQDRFRW